MVESWESWPPRPQGAPRHKQLQTSYIVNDTITCHIDFLASVWPLHQLYVNLPIPSQLNALETRMNVLFLGIFSNLFVLGIFRIIES